MSDQGNMNPHHHQQQQQMMYHQQLMRQQQQRNQQMMQNQQPPFSHPATPPSSQQQQQPSGGSPMPAHMQMSHLQSNQQRSPLAAGIGQPGTPQGVVQSHNMNPMSVPLAQISRPGSVAPPASLPSHIHLVGSPSVPRPGSQMGGSVQGLQRPGSVMAPGSVPMNFNPGSVQNPGSVPAPASAPANYNNPGSVHAAGAISSNYNPGSVQAPASVNMNYAPGSVQGPGSVQQPASVPPNSYNPGSVQPASQSGMGAPNTPSQQTQPSQPTEEQLRLVYDPVTIARRLITCDIRSTIMEMNRRAAGILKTQRDTGEGPSEEDLLQYQRAFTDFTATVDEVDRSLTTVLETAKQISKLEKVFVDKPAKERTSEVVMSCVNEFVDNTHQIQGMFDETIHSVTKTLEHIRQRQTKNPEQDGNEVMMETFGD